MRLVAGQKRDLTPRNMMTIHTSNLLVGSSLVEVRMTSTWSAVTLTIGIDGLDSFAVPIGSLGDTREWLDALRAGIDAAEAAIRSEAPDLVVDECLVVDE